MAQAIRPEHIQGIKAYAIGNEVKEVDFHVELPQQMEGFTVSKPEDARSHSEALEALLNRDRSRDVLTPAAVKILEQAVEALRAGLEPKDPRFRAIRFNPENEPPDTEFQKKRNERILEAHREKLAEHQSMRTQLLLAVLGMPVSPEAVAKADYPALCQQARELRAKGGRDFEQELRQAAERLGAKKGAPVRVHSEDLKTATQLPGESKSRFKLRVAGELSKLGGIWNYEFEIPIVLRDIETR